MPVKETSVPNIRIQGAREHNLKNISVDIPRGKLVVITGVSGSGKSSLAFDTLYAEGYRKYIESLSVSTRYLLENVPKPDVDYIEGLSPVIAIEQHLGGIANPRSTVATVTELASYARLLWSIAGVSHCPKDGAIIDRYALDDCIARLFQEPENAKVILIAHHISGPKSVIRDALTHLKQKGFQRVRLDGEYMLLDDVELEGIKKKTLSLDIVIDRFVIKKNQRSRVADSLELAFKEGKNKAIACVQESHGFKEIVLSQHHACTQCGAVYPAITQKYFSYNHPEGVCEVCSGLGDVLSFEPSLMITDPTKSVKGGAIAAFRIGSKNILMRHKAILKQLSEQLPFDYNTPWMDLPKKTQDLIMHGAGDRLFEFKFGRKKAEELPFEGVIFELSELFRNTSSDGLRSRLIRYQTKQTCQSCAGTRLSARSQNVLLEDVSFGAFMGYGVEDALHFVQRLQVSKSEMLQKLEDVLQGMEERLRFLNEVGLGYLTLNRPFASLSGGEAQRARLATQLGMGLVGVLYVLDEPSIGLHSYDNERLLRTLVKLRDRGNTVVVVEHDEELIKNADHLIELGPAAGTQGGTLLYKGTIKGSLKNKNSRTGPYLGGKLKIERGHRDAREPAGWIEVQGARAHNLKSLNARFPVGLFTCVCGISGSGKSTLINDILAQSALRKLNKAKTMALEHDDIQGLEHFDSVTCVDQEPIGRSPRSNPATYVKLFDPLRQLFAKCSLSKVRGYTASRFSFNIRGGRCERCQGDGAVKIDMQFMGDTYVECPSCEGRRYNRETLEVRFKGHNIADVLDMTVQEALDVFHAIPGVSEKLETLSRVGLGYVKLGQPANTLSGGEAQRIKLSLELSKRQQGRRLYILDEPTTGLHFEDIQKLLDLLLDLRDAGNTIIVIEHHLDVIRLADWIVELGPHGGAAGGEIIYEGDVSGLLKCKKSLTAKSLKEKV